MANQSAPRRLAMLISPRQEKEGALSVAASTRVTVGQIWADSMPGYRLCIKKGEKNGQ